MTQTINNHRRIRLALLSPNKKDQYSETFIRFHKTRIDADVYFLWQGLLPEMSEEGPFVQYSFYNKVRRKLSNLLMPKRLNFHERRIASYLQKNQIDIILAEFGYTGLSMVKLSKKLGIPL